MGIFYGTILFMKYGRLIYFIPWVVGVTGLIVMFGWLIDSRLLIQIYPSFTSMKFFTAFLFFLFGFQLFEIKNYFVSGKIKKTKSYTNIMLSISLIIVFCFFVHISSSVFYGILSLIPINEKYDPWTTIPHIPSVLTLLCFSLIQILQYIIILRKEIINGALFVIGMALIFFSGVVLLSYMFDIQWLFLTTLVGGAMAVHSAILFTIIGLDFLILRRNLSFHLLHHHK